MKNVPWLLFLILVRLSSSSHAQTPQPTSSGDTDRTTFGGSISQSVPAGPVSTSGASATLVRSELSQAEGGATMEFSVALKMRNLAELQQRISNGEIISLDEIAAKYYPTPAAYQATAGWLTAQGFVVKSPDKYNLSVFASGSVSQNERAFGTKFGRVSLGGVQYCSALIAPSLPTAVAGPVLSINGLQPHLHPKAHSQIVSHSPIVSGQPQKLINNQPPYTVPEIANAYNAVGLGVNGNGQKIAIVIDTFPALSDLTLFWESNAIAQSLNNIEEVQVVPGTLRSPSGEESLDVEWSSGMAPGAKVRVYATLDLTFVHLDQGYQAIINDLPTQPTLHQVSLSYGLSEKWEPTSQMETDAQYFAIMAGCGVTVFVSSGDGGSSPGPNGWEDNTGPVRVECPANDLNVTSVGGTSIYLASNGAVSNETAWSFGGGGSSQVFARPSWQTGAGLPAGSFRTVPDVALAADLSTGGYLVLNGTVWIVGGTSWGAPTWAGICAMINQARANSGQPALGLLGPKIYPLNGTNSFRNIITGSNGGDGVYNAGMAYNMCTGLGVPSVAAMIQALAFSPSESLPTAPVITNFISYSGDFSGDGRQDILWRNTLTGEVRIWYMSGATILSNDHVATVDLDWKISAIGDFNGDGISDILWVNKVDGSFAIWTMHGDSFSSHQYPSPGSQWSITGLADLGHTGMADIIWRNQVTGAVQIWWSRSPFNFSSESVSAVVGLDWNLVGTADLFGNGIPEMIWRNQNSGEVRAWQLSGDSVVANAGLGVVPLNWQIVGLADFNGDGRQDILWRNTTDGSVDVWLMNGFGAPSQLFSAAVPQDWQVVASPNIFGSKLSSILWSNTTTGQLLAWGTDGATVSGTAQIGITDSTWRVQPAVGNQ